VVAEHPRAVEQLLGEPQRTSGIAGQEDPLGDRLVRLEDHWCVRHVRADSG